MRTRTIEIAGGVQVVVPDSLNLLTPYVLFEQGDWFEDEIGFVRRLLRPGHRTIDVGANYGVYTLTMAKSVGPSGAVWAFEPASGTAELLAQSVAANGFTQVVVECSALSNTCGTARLALNDNSEFNSLLRNDLPAVASETVLVVTLDDGQARYGWKDIAFMKIDAEGEESKIIEGGQRFFTECSPLILYEIKAGANLHLELVQQFARIGFDSYRLIPGLDLLVPFDVDSQPDGYLLNLFCCKKDRAASLAEMGLLLDAPTIKACTATGRFERFYQAHRDNYTWDRRLCGMPYAASLSSLWRTPVGESAPIADILACYSVSQDASLDSFERLRGLEISIQLLKSLGGEVGRYMRFSSLARVARDYGARTVAMNAIKQLLDSISLGRPIDASEPFLAPSKRFDQISPGERTNDWILAASAELFEQLQSFSSFYMGDSSRPRLELIASLGFGSEEMDRRLQLLKARFAS